MIAHINPPVLQAASGRGYAGRLEGSIPGYRAGAMLDFGYELPRISIPRTPVNKGKHKAGTFDSPGSLASGLPTLSVSRLLLRLVYVDLTGCHLGWVGNQGS